MGWEALSMNWNKCDQIMIYSQLELLVYNSLVEVDIIRIKEFSKSNMKKYTVWVFVEYC